MVRIDPKLLGSQRSFHKGPFYIFLLLLVAVCIGGPSFKAIQVGFSLGLETESLNEQVVAIALNEPAPARGIFGTLVALSEDGNRRILFREIPIGTSRGRIATFRMTASDKEEIQRLIDAGEKFEFFPAPVEGDVRREPKAVEGPITLSN